MTPDQIKLIDSKIKCACECIDKKEPETRTLGFLMDAHNILEHAKRNPTPTTKKVKSVKLITHINTGAMESILENHFKDGWRLAGNMFINASTEFSQLMVLEE